MSRNVVLSPQNEQRGYILPAVLSLILAISFFSAALITVIVDNFFVVGNNVRSQQAFNIAEAGANYCGIWRIMEPTTRMERLRPLRPTQR
jgi:Tfp pilus assembly protein PilX